MEHFVAYHSVKTMGYTYEPCGELNFLSRKLGLLKRSIGNTIWVIQGVPTGKATDFTLVGCYLANAIEIVDEQELLYSINGTGFDCKQPVPLNQLPWFADLKKSQSNFSLGFNTLKNPEIISALQALIEVVGFDVSGEASIELDADIKGVEGKLTLISHLRRERDGELARVKKQQTLAQLKSLKCEVCGFDFQEKYGELGSGFCEVHHRYPLGEQLSEITTTLADLAIICANCHRMIHRQLPSLSVESLRSLIINNKL